MFFSSLSKNTQKMVRASFIAAIYVLLCIIFAPISFGVVQVRISEALTLLAVLCPEAIAGVTIGCFLSNMISGQPVDMIVGTIATLLAAIATYKLRNIRWKSLPILASLPPVIFNAIIIGIELTILYSGINSAFPIYFANMATIGLGQIISCCIVGLALIKLIEKNHVLHKLFIP